MKAFFAFLKKEALESVRSGKLVILIILFILFGILSPAIAKLMPWMLETLADSLSGSGLMVTEVQVDALTSWTQFFKNIPIALIVFILLYQSIFVKEYQTGTLTLMVTKGLSRCKVVFAKISLMFFVWTLGYGLCFAITYGYNAYFWDNGIAEHLLEAGAFWWLFGVWTICLVVLFSTVFTASNGVLLGTGGGVLLSYLLGFLPKIKEFTPARLLNGTSLLLGAESTGSYWKACAVTIFLCGFCIAASIPIMNKRRI